ncbi:sensor domain-containing protein [Mycobacterium sp. TY815]|uniref:sensor domain-containing protein n=1 Tax=Mycobacterium sp. TY815 TaxID=3050581 RepID=UPI0027412CA2|nr:sensor domain-containing protein [Mycobacterium sp. TY815]MDP7707421.1 sensor domain-containing protein [Mycobacterium sp. TY815]
MSTRFAVTVAAGVVCAAVSGGCSTTVPGVAHVAHARVGAAPTVTADGLDRLLLTEQQIGPAVGVSALLAGRSYTVIEPPRGESYTDPSCASTLFNTMYTGYEGSGYTAVAGRKLHESSAHHTHEIDEAVVAFPSADAAARFVVRTALDWERCFDIHLGVSNPHPDPVTVFYTLGFPSTSGDVATVVNTLEGGEGAVCAHAIASRSNVVIDVHVGGPDITAAQPVAVITAIAANMPQ